MANGQQKAKENVDKFDAWVATQTDEDFRQIVHRGILKRTEVAKGAGFAKSALNQNPEIKRKLDELERSLRQRGVLPPLTEASMAAEGQPKEYDQGARRRQLDASKVAYLEKKNLALEARVRELEAELERFGELSDTVAEMGLMPR